MCTKSNEDVEIQVRSKTQKTDDKNDTAPQTQPGTVLPNWAEEKPLPSLSMSKAARSCTALSSTLTLQALPAIPNCGPIPPDPQLSFQGARGLTPSSTKSTLANWDAPAVACFRFVI